MNDEDKKPSQDLDRGRDFPSTGTENPTEAEALALGKLSEIVSSLKEGESQSISTSGARTAGQREEREEDRLRMRAELLKTAPSENVMKKDIESRLEVQRKDLEYSFRRAGKKKDYHALSQILQELRQVLRTLENLARLSYEALQDLWLKVVHQFA